jgi:hypothetical protein
VILVWPDVEGSEGGGGCAFRCWNGEVSDCTSTNPFEDGVGKLVSCLLALVSSSSSCMCPEGFHHGVSRRWESHPPPLAEPCANATPPNCLTRLTDRFDLIPVPATTLTLSGWRLTILFDGLPALADLGYVGSRG